MSADFGPCENWPVTWTCDVDTESATATGAAVAAATRVLWAFSGRRFGTCEVTLRPCREDCYDTTYWSVWMDARIEAGYGNGMPLPFGDYWFTLGCGSCGNSCSCSEVSEVQLPYPVNSVVSVKVDGSPLVTGAYRVDNNRLLVRTDGQRWPRCNNLNRSDSQAGTWSVTAKYGEDVPVSGQLAVGQLACEILKAMRGEDCRLPAGVTQLARQGVTITIPDFAELVKDGRTGLYLVDMFLFSENPNRLMRRGRAFDPDRILPRRPS